MKTIGLLGGMSWESTELYYRLINEGVKTKLGGLHSARIAMVSVDFQEIEVRQHSGDWEGLAWILAKAAQQVEAAGADFLLICTNTMHKVAPQVQEAINIPPPTFGGCDGAPDKGSRYSFHRFVGDKFHDGARFLQRTS